MCLEPEILEAKAKMRLHTNCWFPRTESAMPECKIRQLPQNGGNPAHLTVWVLCEFALYLQYRAPHGANMLAC